VYSTSHAMSQIIASKEYSCKGISEVECCAIEPGRSEAKQELTGGNSAVRGTMEARNVLISNLLSQIEDLATNQGSWGRILPGAPFLL
jgi:hypothetical protein